MPLPNQQDRIEILEKHLNKVPIDKSVNIKEIALNPKCDRYSGADISSLVKEAQANCVRRYHKDLNKDNLKVNQSDFDLALNKIVPSVSKKDMLSYEKVN